MVWKKYPDGNVTQWFQENRDLYYNWSVQGSPHLLPLQGHNGIDIVMPYGTPIYAVSDQKVVEVRNKEDGYGKHVKCLDSTHEWVYGHMSSISVVIGQSLAEGDLIGLEGNSGFVVSGSTPYWEHNPFAGAHLHIGARKFTPRQGSGSYNIQYQSGDRGTIENYDNGFRGAVDPFPLFHIELLTVELLIGTDELKRLRAFRLTLQSIWGFIKMLLTKLFGILK